MDISSYSLFDPAIALQLRCYSFGTHRFTSITFCNWICMLKYSSNYAFRCVFAYKIEVQFSNTMDSLCVLVDLQLCLEKGGEGGRMFLL